MRRSAEDRGRRRRAVRALCLAAALLFAGAAAWAQDDAPRRIDSGRFTVVYYPQDDRLARALVSSAAANDSFPWLPRPQQRVLIAVAPDAEHFRSWAGPDAPEWGAALAFPDSRRVIIQGRRAGSDAGDPIEVLRHELAHLALHERLGNQPPRWFDEGYASVAAREWRREDLLAANVALALKGPPSFDQVESGFFGGSFTAQSSYALSYRAVSELAALDPDRGLTLFFRYWSAGATMDGAMRQAFGLTLGGFEKHFQQRTQLRYGGLALFADISIASLILMILIMPFYLARRSRDRRRMAAMRAAEEAADRAEQESALASLVAGTSE